MEYSEKFSFNVEWNYKTMALFLFLMILPNLLGLINLSTVWGFKIHFFQIAVFIAALIYGPKGGLLSGLVGSLYPAFIMSNPYIVIGNAILGFFVGLFVRYNLNTIIAVMLAYCIQLPWLIITDYYLVNLPISLILRLILALAISNLVWAIVANYTVKPIKESLIC